MKRPSFQFYPADWRKDPLLSTCSLAARGLWIELMCVAHESAEYGHLSINDKPMTLQQLARTVGETPAAVGKLIEELEQSGVFSRNEQGSIFSRRMVKDEHIRNVRADSGRLGGNPNLLNQKGKQKVKQNVEQIPTPSSSSSSSKNHSVTNVTGGEPPKLTDPEEIIFGYGLTMLVSAGTPDKNARSFLGGLRKGYGDAALIAKLRECAQAKPLQPVEWLAAAMPPGGVNSKTPKQDNFASKNYGSEITAL